MLSYKEKVKTVHCYICCHIKTYIVYACFYFLRSTFLYVFCLLLTSALKIIVYIYHRNIFYSIWLVDTISWEKLIKQYDNLITHRKIRLILLHFNLIVCLLLQAMHEWIILFPNKCWMGTHFIWRKS
jgi:hypothetical protein